MLSFTKSHLPGKTLFFIFIACFLSSFLHATIINVPVPYTTIQAGITASANGDTVLVQPGTYVENINYNGKLITVGSLYFTIADTSYISTTIIDGNSSGSVVTFNNSEDSTAVLCGFTITNGLGGGSIPNCYGGGITCINLSNPSLRNLSVINNSSASDGGGGIHCGNSNPILQNVTITGNSAKYGGGIMCFNVSNPSLDNVIISNNSATHNGGGIYCLYDSSPSLEDVTITGNSATYYGGGIMCFNVSSPSLGDVTISGNSAEHGGGVYCDTNSSPTLTDVTITANSASDGGGIYCFNSSPSLVNCIMWNDSPGEIFIYSGSVTATYSDIEGGWTGTGNIDSDPLFMNPGSGDYHLGATSPCINTGDPDSQYNDPDGTIADMGAYYYIQQYFGPVWHISTTGSDITGTSSEEFPFASIQLGINFSSDTETVLVQPGTYVENINYNGKLITVGSLFLTTQDTTYISSTTIDGNSSGSVVIFESGEDSNAILCGFTITNGSATYGGGIYCDSSSPSLDNVIISNNSASVYGGGIYFDWDCYSSLQNVTITDNSASADGGGIWCGSSSPSLVNCIMWNNLPQEIYLGPGPVTVTYSDIEGGWTGTGNINSDPLFNDAPNNDYSLSSLSPCINRGDPTTTPVFVSSIGSGDLNDALNRIDMGAYEYSSESGVIPDGTTISGNQAINSDLYIQQDFTCTVSAGTTFEFEQETGMNIGGDLNAIGEYNNLITFTTFDTLSGWNGLNFVSSISDTSSSNLEFCVIEYGLGDPSGEQANGGNIYIKDYDEITLRNCKIKSGNAENGGGIYGDNSKLNILNCVLDHNQVTQSGGAVFAHHSESSLINLTVADNIAGTDGGGLAFSDESYSQPEIMNCIIWDNGVAPIIPGSGALTNISYCDLEFTYPGSNNVYFPPAFTGEIDHPYNIENYSFCLNSGLQDTTGLNLPAIDILGNPRVFGHTNAFYDRIDIGAYEFQGILAPSNFTASDGDSAYPGYVQLSWNYNSSYSPTPVNFRIFRDDISIILLDGQTFTYSDYTAVPGQVYNYYVQASADGLTGDSQEDSGYIKPNGIISGTVLTANNNPVQGVKVSLDPSTGYCLEFDSLNPSELTIENPVVNMDYNFTIEFWVKTSLSDVIILNKGVHNFKINTAGNVEYTDDANTLVQSTDTLSVNDGDWHHLALVNDYTNTSTKLYLDEAVIAQQLVYTFSGSSESGFSTDTAFTGFIDDLRIWSTARDSSEIVDGMNIVAAVGEIGLAGYWPLNEGNGDYIFDATDYSHNGLISDCDWSTNDPEILLGAFTDVWGEYIIRQINYGVSTTFTVTPFKSGHIFQPEQRNVTLSTSNIAQNDIDFIDNSLIPISGYVKYQSTECPVVGAMILLNGSPPVPLIITNENGYYVMEVEHGTECILSVDYSGHIFNREWHLGVVTFPQTDINFEDAFKTQFRCEVVGGDDHYPIGDFNVTLLSVNGCYLDTLSGENWSSGGIMITNLPPLDYNVTVDPTGVDPFNLAIDDQFQSMKTALISLTNPDSLLDTLRFVWKADLQIEVAWADTLVLQHFPEYPESEFYVLPQNEWCEIEIRAFEDYSYDGHPNQITYLDDCDLVITDEVGTTGITETAFQDTIVYTYTFAPYLPNILTGYSRQYQNMLEITAEDSDLNRFATQTDWVLTEGVKPLESTYATTSPEIPFMIIHDPPGDGSSSSFG